MIIMKTTIISKSNKVPNKKISFSEGLKIVKSIQKKVETFKKSEFTPSSPNEYSF